MIYAYIFICILEVFALVTGRRVRKLRREVAELSDSVKAYEMTIEDIYSQIEDLNFVVQP